MIFAGYPVFVIRPFRAQGADELAAALWLSQYKAAVTVISALAALAALLSYWRGRGRRMIAVTSIAVLVCALAAVAQINHFELMFHPVNQPKFAAASDVKLDADDKVLAIRIGGHSRAYPIRAIAYHHIVNDEVGGRAVVTTY